MESNFYQALFILLIVAIIYIYFEYTKKYNSDYLKYADDVSELNKTYIKDLIYIQSVDDIVHIVLDAKQNKIPIAMRGQHHTMGGQTLIHNGYILDMKHFNKIIDFNISNDIPYVIVNSGILWNDLIKFLNTYGYSPMILQSYSSFSVGGSISVNAHGITSDETLSESILEIKIINYSGNKITCDRQNNYELFSLIIGGYGLFGVIYEVKLKIVPNCTLKLNTYKLNKYNFQDKYFDILNDPNVNIKLARIDITNMTTIKLYTLINKQNSKNIISKLSNKPHEMSYITKILYKWMLPIEFFQKMRYYVENLTNKPIDIPNISTRNEILYESADSLAKLYSPFVDLNKTHILQEFFVPPEHFIYWMDNMKDILLGKKFNYVILINITIRYVKQDITTFLKYAVSDMYAFVMYFRIDKTDMALNEFNEICKQLRSITADTNGTFYLPYTCNYNKNELLDSYPNINEFIKLKQHYDPINLFQNNWFNYVLELV